MAGGRKIKVGFAALPSELVDDERFRGKALHWAIMAVIASHDRMSLVTGSGQGCWSSAKNMAERIGCHVSSFSVAVNELVEWGYLQRDRAGKNWVYRVVYQPVAEADSLPTGKSSEGGDSLPAGELSPGTVCLENEKSAVSQPFPHDKDILRSVRDYAEAEIHSAEAEKDIPLSGASLRDARAADDDDDASLVAELTKLERTLKHQPDQVDAAAVYRHMFDLLGTDLPPGRSAQVERIAFAAHDAVLKQAGQSLRPSPPERTSGTFAAGIDTGPSRDLLLDRVREGWRDLDFMQKPMVARQVGMSEHEIGEVLAGRAHISDLKLTALRSAVVAEVRSAVPQEIVERPRRKAAR